MSPNLPRKELPNRARRPSKQAEQSQAFLAAERKKTVKYHARQGLKSRRAQQELEQESQRHRSPASPSPVPPSPPLPTRKGKQPVRSEGGSNLPAPAPARQPKHFSQTSTSRATVNASIGHGTQAPRDSVLEEILAEEREREDELAWFAENHPEYNVKTFDYDELVQLWRELDGPGPTLPLNHDPYPNVRVEPPAPRPAKRPLSYTPPQGKYLVGYDHWRARKKLVPAEELGVNSSFNHPPARAARSALHAGSLPARPAPRVAQSQPVCQSTLHVGVQPPLVTSQPAPNTAMSRPRTQGDRQVHAPSTQHRDVAPIRPLQAQRPHIEPPPARPPLRTPALGASAGGAPVPTKNRLGPERHVPSPPPVIPPTREPPSAADYGPGVEPDDFDLVMDYVDDHLPGRPIRPRRSEWTGLTLQLIDRAADESKARLIATGYMKGAEERQLMIILSWHHACQYYNLPHPYPKISDRQIRHIQNMFPPCRKLMKTRLERNIISDFDLRKGTTDQIKARVAGLLPHTFHSATPTVPGGRPVHFKRPFIGGVLSEMVFRDEKDLGIKFNSLFNPIPPRMLALAYAMVNDIISEHESGHRVSKATYVEGLRPLFNTYLLSLKNFRLANRGNYRTLLMQLHNECITSSGAMRGVEDNRDRFILPVEAFDMEDTEPYEPQYTADALHAMLTRNNYLGLAHDCADDCDDTPPICPNQPGRSQRGRPAVDDRSYGQPGPGPSTLRHKQAARAVASEGSDVGSEGDRFGGEEEGISEGAGAEDREDAEDWEDVGNEYFS